MSGMVTMPTAMTLLTAAPEIMPKSPDPTTAILAAPPRNWPIADMARSAKYAEPPVRLSTCPMRVKGTTISTATPRIAPIIPLTSSPRYTARRWGDTDRVRKSAGRCGPTNTQAPSTRMIATSVAPAVRAVATSTSRMRIRLPTMPSVGSMASS